MSWYVLTSFAILLSVKHQIICGVCVWVFRMFEDFCKIENTKSNNNDVERNKKQQQHTSKPFDGRERKSEKK